MTHHHTSVLAAIACASCALVNCPNCDGTGKVLGAWDIEEDCPADGCADGRVTIAERDAILERLDGLQHRSRP